MNETRQNDRRQIVEHTSPAWRLLVGVAVIMAIYSVSRRWRRKA